MCSRRLGSAPAGASSVLAELARWHIACPFTPGRTCRPTHEHAGHCGRHLYRFLRRCARGCCRMLRMLPHCAAAACHTRRPPSLLPQAPEPAARCTPLTLQHAEINFVLIGVLLQMASVATESTRLTLVQILLQVRLTRRRVAVLQAQCTGLRSMRAAPASARAQPARVYVWMPPANQQRGRACRPARSGAASS